MALTRALDPYERPPDHIRDVYKFYQKMKPKDLAVDPDIIDFSRGLSEKQQSNIKVIDELDLKKLNEACQNFEDSESDLTDEIETPILVYEHSDMPGLHILPSLLPPSTQRTLLSRLLHRDLSNPAHLTNIHAHYSLLYPPPTEVSSTSFFTQPPHLPAIVAIPHDPVVHKSIPVPALLNRKLRWLTLGGQYDWTAKRYPSTPPPPFPPDIGSLLSAIFPETKPEAAIVNLYTPGDTLSVHRDVAEGSGRGLHSVSLGCEGIFVVGYGGRGDMEGIVLTFRLPSGSAVYMSGEARFAWHGVPQVVAGTCPEYLKDWPAEELKKNTDREEEAGKERGEFEEWRGWMSTKRVNLNVRQMWD